MIAQQTTTSAIVIAGTLMLIVVYQVPSLAHYNVSRLTLLQILIRDWSYERLFHFCQELTLLISHILILLFRTPYLFDSSAFCTKAGEVAFFAREMHCF